jgi:hypothetical protein
MTLRSRDFEPNTHNSGLLRSSHKESETEEDTPGRPYEALIRILKDFDQVCNEPVMTHLSFPKTQSRLKLLHLQDSVASFRAVPANRSICEKMD